MVKTILIARHGFRTSWGNNGRFPMGMSARKLLAQLLKQWENSFLTQLRRQHLEMSL